jgi:hypothetical protein
VRKCYWCDIDFWETRTTLNVAVEWLALLLRFWDVQRSNLETEMGYPKVVCSSHQSSQKRVRYYRSMDHDRLLACSFQWISRESFYQSTPMIICTTACVVIFQVLAAASRKMRAFGDTTPCSLVRVDRSSRGAYCLHHQGDEWTKDLFESWCGNLGSSRAVMETKVRSKIPLFRMLNRHCTKCKFNCLI